MTWIKTVPLTEADEELRQGDRGAKGPVPDRVRDAGSSHRRRSVADRGIAQPDSRGALPCVCDIRRADVPRLAARPAPARDDHHRGFGHQPVPLLNRIARRVSASGDTGRRTGSSARKGLHRRSDYECRSGSCWTTWCSSRRMRPASGQRITNELRAAGFDDRAILQITLIASWFNYINRVADALGVGRE